MKVKNLTKQYNEYSDEYSKIFDNYNQESIEAYFKYFPEDLSKKKILDIGCGDGSDLAILRERNAEVYGMDSSESMVALAQKKNEDAIVKVGFFDEIPFNSESFDFVISKWAIQTTALIDPVYQEVHRVLKPGGNFLFLACHPIRQFIEKKKDFKNYFKKEIVESIFFGGKIKILEPSHTFNEYLSPAFFELFTLLGFEEGFDSAAEQIDNDIYPSYFIFNCKKK